MKYSIYRRRPGCRANVAYSYETSLEPAGSPLALLAPWVDYGEATLHLILDIAPYEPATHDSPAEGGGIDGVSFMTIKGSGAWEPQIPGALREAVEAYLLYHRERELLALCDEDDDGDAP